MKTWKGFGTSPCSPGPESHTSCETRTGTSNIWITSSQSMNWTTQHCNTCSPDLCPPPPTEEDTGIIPEYHFIFSVSDAFFFFLNLKYRIMNTLTPLSTHSLLSNACLWLLTEPSPVQVPPAPKKKKKSPLLSHYLTATVQRIQHSM